MADRGNDGWAAIITAAEARALDPALAAPTVLARLDKLIREASPIVSVEIGRSTWQGPAEEAPGRAGNRDADERYGRAAGQQVRALVANLSVWAGKAHPDQQLVDLAHVLAILDSNPAALTPAPQPEGQVRARIEIARLLPPPGKEG